VQVLLLFAFFSCPGTHTHCRVQLTTSRAASADFNMLTARAAGVTVFEVDGTGEVVQSAKATVGSGMTIDAGGLDQQGGLTITGELYATAL